MISTLDAALSHVTEARSALLPGEAFRAFGNVIGSGCEGTAPAG